MGLQCRDKPNICDDQRKDTRRWTQKSTTMSLLPFVRGEGGRRPDEGSVFRRHSSHTPPHPYPLPPNRRACSQEFIRGGEGTNRSTHRRLSSPRMNTKPRSQRSAVSRRSMPSPQASPPFREAFERPEHWPTRYAQPESHCPFSELDDPQESVPD